jgi:hypothetical protein
MGIGSLGFLCFGRSCVVWSSSSCTRTTEPQPDERTCGLDTLQASATDVGDGPPRAAPVAHGTDLYGLVQSGGAQWECL